jgi:hypothetical protein
MDPDCPIIPVEERHDWDALTDDIESAMADRTDTLEYDDDLYMQIAVTAQAGEALGDEACELADRACVEAGLLEPVEG